MSSNHIVYTDDEESDGEEIFQMEDVVKKTKFYILVSNI